ncbi:MAG: hypothetical protein M3463_14015, partial [Verrucomicrobiota bacterium]|nr:hypothetical protein [Verrucomicrobiota bacterium]
LEVVPADDSVNLIEVPTRYPNAPIFPLTIRGKSFGGNQVSEATIEVRIRNSSPVQVVSRMKVLVVPELPLAQLKFYFVEDLRYHEAGTPTGAMLGTKIRDDYGGPGSMYDEADQRFNQIGAQMQLFGATEHRNVPFLGPPQFYRYPMTQTGPEWGEDALDFENSGLMTQFFPREFFPEGHIGTILVHRLSGRQGGYYSAETTLCFIAYDKWFPGGLGEPTYPYWGGPWGGSEQPGSVLAPDAIGRAGTRARVFAHEVGHALLPVRNRPNFEREPPKPPVNGWAGGHDFGPAPKNTDALMRGTGTAKGKWLRHEDWETAIRELMRRMGVAE